MGQPGKKFRQNFLARQISDAQRPLYIIADMLRSRWHKRILQVKLWKKGRLFDIILQ
jgi:hypothetical protein